MIYKQSSFASFSPTGEPLMGVISPDDLFGMEKLAGCHPDILRFKQQLEPQPNKTYVHILALGAGDYYGPNLNNDHFPWVGLSHDHTTTPHPMLHGYKTFLNAHSFAHHVNKDPEKAYGDVILSVLNEQMKRVELVVAIDHAKCEKNGGREILQKIHEGKYPATSMGCRVPFDRCSICDHRAKTRAEYCDHMRTAPGRILDDGRKVFVYNDFPRFFDISFVFIGADRTSFVLEKVASGEGIFVPSAYGESFTKEAGSTRLSKSLRKAVGLHQDSLVIRKKHKVQKQTRLTPKGMTFGKTQKLVSASRFTPVSMLTAHAVMPGPTVTTRSVSGLGLSFDDGPTDVFMSRQVQGKQIRELPQELEEEMEMIEKEASLKYAEAEKISEIFKRVNPLPMGRAVPMRVGREPRIPNSLLDRMADRGDLPSTFGGLGAAGIMLRPSEFQRVYLRANGAGDLAERLSQQGSVFPQNMPGSVGRVRISVIGRAPASLMRDLGPLLPERSSLTPVAIRRTAIIARRPEEREGDEMDDGAMRSLSGAYDSYRTNLLLNSEGLMRSAMDTPEIMNMIRSERGGDYMSAEGIMESLSVLPVLYFANAYRKSVCHCGMTPIQFAIKFSMCNPHITKYLARLVSRAI